MKINTEDIVNKKFEFLTVVNFIRKEITGNHHKFNYFYHCSCDCGKSIEITRKILLKNERRKYRSSCGCLVNVSGFKNTLFKGVGEISGRVWADIKYKALRRNINFNVTAEDLWKQAIKQNYSCNLTGVKLNFFKGINKTNRIIGTASLDRIDSARGYEIDNIQWVHKDINMMKLSHTPERFLELCYMVVDHSKRGK